MNQPARPLKHSLFNTNVSRHLTTQSREQSYLSASKVNLSLHLSNMEGKLNVDGIPVKIHSRKMRR